MKKWTISMVNFFNKGYLPWQLKSTYEFNNPEEFELIIIDHTADLYTGLAMPEKDAIEALVDKYSKYNNIKVFYWDETYWRSHGQGLNLALRECETPYFLAQDPDFFWLQKGYLKILESFLVKGNVAVGGPYPVPLTNYAVNFPAAWGCAYRFDEIKDLDFELEWDENKKDVVCGRDVGWRIRDALYLKPYVHFNYGVIRIPGDNKDSQTYYYNDKLISLHCYRGSYTPDSFKEDELHNLRGKYCYNLLRENNVDCWNS